MALRRTSSARDDFLRLPLIRAEERTLREGAYDDRRSGVIRDAKYLVAELMREVPGEGMVESTVLNRIRNLSRPLDRPDSEGWHLPKGRDEEWFLDHLVHRGVLQLNAEGLHSCPIPNFRTHLMVRGGLVPEHPPQREAAPELTRTERGRGIEIT